jgi:hypothetical protein
METSTPMAWKVAGLYVATVLAGILTALFAAGWISDVVSSELSKRVQGFPFDQELSDRAVIQVRMSTAIGDGILAGDVDDALALTCFLVEMSMADLNPNVASDDGWRQFASRIRQEGLEYVARARLAGKCERTWEEERGPVNGQEH